MVVPMANQDGTGARSARTANITFNTSGWAGLGPGVFTARLTTNSRFA